MLQSNHYLIIIDINKKLMHIQFDEKNLIDWMEKIVNLNQKIENFLK